MIDLVVIGAGPAGIMAAGIAAEKGNSVILLEKMPKPLLKLGITGKGRCNLTNAAEIKDILTKFNVGNRFLKYAIHEFSNNRLMEFFEKKGIKLKIERGNRVFPENDKALEIVGVLKDWIRNLNVEIKTEIQIQEILTRDRSIESVSYLQKGEVKKISCKNLLIATGGLSYPKTGSTGDGYKMAKELGHRIVSPKAALVPLITEKKIYQLQGLKLKNVAASILVNGKKICENFGELYFTDYGIDGPVVLTMSNEAIKNLQSGKEVSLSIDLKPALTHKQIKNRLIREINKPDNKILAEVVRKLLPEKLTEYCLKELGLSKDRKTSEITVEERKKIRLWLKDFQIKITGHRPIEEAIITAGGVDLREIDPITMESKIVKNLYFAGEIMDIDAKTGGYNLQAAFSTGYVVGKSI